MKLFFDTSSLIKKYINEKGSDIVDKLFNEAKIIYVSIITELEASSTFRRLLVDKAITENDYKTITKEINKDFNYFYKIDFDFEVIAEAKKLIKKYQIKTLDSIQLASVNLIKDGIDNFIVSDTNLKKYAANEGIKIIDPND